MVDFVVIVIIMLAVVVGIIYSIKHFKGEGRCCDGGSFKPRKKKLANVLYKKTFHIEGMHCEHCRNRVTEIVNDIDNVAGVVNLKSGELIVSYAADVSDEVIAAKIEKFGYKVV